MPYPRPVRGERQFTGRHMLLVVLGFFGVIIAVNVGMALVATGTFPGVTVANSYVASQNYNRAVAETRSLADKGRSVVLDAPAGVVTVRVLAADGSAVEGLDVVATAGRPSSQAEDRTLALAASAGGYRAGATLPAGQWDIAIEASRDGAPVIRERRRIFVEE
jgi:nitrogen fixation protein FixH